MSKRIVKFPAPRAEGAKWFEIRNATEESADIFLYDYIGDSWSDTSAAAVVTQLKNLKSRKINLRINFPGGDVFDGLAIYNALARHDAEVTTYIDGLAASIASVIALAGRRVLIADNAMMMIHDPVAVTMGTAGELRKHADVLDQIKESIINTYAGRTALERGELAEMMSEETWFTASEAVEHGFADEAIAGVQAAAGFDLRLYGFLRLPPRELYPQKTHTAAAAPAPAAPPPASAKPPASATPRSLLMRKQALLEKSA